MPARLPCACEGALLLVVLGSGPPALVAWPATLEQPLVLSVASAVAVAVAMAPRARQGRSCHRISCRPASSELDPH